MPAAGQGDEPVPLDRDEPGDGIFGLGDLLIDPPQRAAAAIGAVLVADGLVPAAGGFLRPGGRPGLGEDLPAGKVLAGVLAPPLGDRIGDVGDTGTEDERQPGVLDRLLVSLGDHPRVRDYGDVGELVGSHERGDDRQHGPGLGLVALKRLDHQREPGRVGQQPHGDLRLQAAFPGEPLLPEPVPLIG